MHIYQEYRQHNGGKEYNDQNYDGMKKVYLIWILPQAAKKRDGQVSICKTDEKSI